MIYTVAVLQIALIIAAVLYVRSTRKQQLEEHAVILQRVLDGIQVSGQAVTSAVFKELKARTEEFSGVVTDAVTKNAEELDEQLVKAFSGLSDSFKGLHEHVTQTHHAAGEDRIRFNDSVQALVKLIKPEDFPNVPRQCPKQ